MKKYLTFLLLISFSILASSFSFAEDTDHDGLPDAWELANGRDPLVADYMVSAGGSHTCALPDTGVVCWDRGRGGQSTVSELTNPTHQTFKAL